MQGYCMNCQKMVEMLNVSTVITRNRKYAYEGICSNKKCNSKVLKFVKGHELEPVAFNKHIREMVPKNFIIGADTPERLVKKIEKIEEAKEIHKQIEIKELELKKGELNAKTPV